MNERIAELRARAQELAAEAFPGDVPFDPNPNPILWDRIHISYEKFAELIVDQMLAITDAHTEVFQTDRDQALIEHIKQSVKQHFGAKE